ncbi:MAG: hypothetical protein BSR46_09400 [Candidatus Dactylopiibacterium carminicum]|nr:glycosyltransferase [Candidatus Dactylopiibacterium carminicum]PAS99199.1 MAG: hypothetical protein BSR46_09400 [Candidatus Dactylopiibacterium carminicum]
MRILVVTPLVYGGGAEQVAAVLSREWAREHEVRVLAFNAEGPQLDFGVPVEDMQLPARKGLFARASVARQRVRRLTGVAGEFRPDVVMAFMDEAGMVCCLAGLRGGWLKRLVVSVHHNPRWLSAGRRLALTLLYRLPARVVAVSRGVAGELMLGMGLSLRTLRHIPNPLATAEAPDAASLAQAEALAPGFILFVGRLDRHTKGLDTLLEAYAGLPAGRPALVIVGDGPDRTWLAGEIAQQALENVHCLGWQRDPAPFYARAGVLVMSSRYEGWSNVLMEAIGAGCPVAATHCPYGPAEILGEEFADWLVEVNDAPALAEGIQARLALQGEARAAVSERLRARAARFAAPEVAQTWIALAHELGAPA